MVYYMYFDIICAIQDSNNAARTSKCSNMKPHDRITGEICLYKVKSYRPNDYFLIQVYDSTLTCFCILECAAMLRM